MKPGFYIDYLEPGADNPKEHAPLPEPEPPEGFVDNTVYRYKLVDGKEVLIGTMEAFPEGWDHPQQFREKGFQKKKEDEAMVKPLENREELIQQAKALMQDGLNLTKAAKEVGIGTSTLSVWLKKERQAANQEPAQESQESATEIIPELEYLKQTGKEEEYGCPFDEPAYNPNPPEDNDFTAEDDEPIPYMVVEENSKDVTLDDMKVIWIQNVMENSRLEAKTKLRYIGAIAELRA